MGHREGTERNPGGHGAELGAQFPCPSWVSFCFFCVENREDRKHREGRRRKAAEVSLVGAKRCARSPWLPLGAFLLCRESEAKRKQREEGVGAERECVAGF